MLVVLTFLSYIWSLSSILHENIDDGWMNEYWVLVELYSQRKNLSTQRKLCPSATLSTINPTCTGLGLRLGVSGDKLATNHLRCTNSQIPWYRYLLVLTLFRNIVEIKNVTPSWHYILLYHHSHHRDNVTAPHGRPNLRSRLHFCHA